MRFAVRLPGGPKLPDNRRLMKQLECTDVIVHQPEPGANLLLEKIEVEKDGLRFEVIDGSPAADKILWNRPGREEQLEDFCTTLRHWGEAGIKVVTVHQWPPKAIWRTFNDRPTRGGATSGGFDHGDIEHMPPIGTYSGVTEEEAWENMAYFLKETLPVAEGTGVLMTFHPDDPPIPSNQGVPRILHSVAAFDRLLELAPSDNLGLNFCVGCFAEMGADVPAAIRHFGKKIFTAHFRNVTGSASAPGGFQEVFHDDPAGRVDMFEAMKAFYEVGFEGPMRPDHSPKMQGDEHFDERFGGTSGYYVMGKVLAIGYMKALAESIEKTGY